MANLKEYVCPNCGATTTNADFCEHCGSLLVRFAAQGIDISNTPYADGSIVFPGLIEELEKNLRYQEEGKEEVFTMIKWINKSGEEGELQISPEDAMSDSKDFHVQQIVIYLDFDRPISPASPYFKYHKNKDAELTKFTKLKSFPLFTSDMGEDDDDIDDKWLYRGYYLNCGQDVEGAARLISEIMMKVKGVSPADSYGAFTRYEYDDFQDVFIEWMKTHGFDYSDYVDEENNMSGSVDLPNETNLNEKFKNEDDVVTEENDSEKDPEVTSESNFEEDVEMTQENDQVIDDSDVYEIIQAKGLDKAAEWYKKRNYCTLEEAKDMVILIKEKYDAAQFNNEGNTDESDEKKKTPYIIIGIIVVGLVIIGALFSNSNQSEQNTDVVLADSVLSVDSVEMDIKSPEFVKAYLEDILNKAIRIPEERAVEKYFTKDFIKLYKEVENSDKENIEPGDVGFWDFDFWTGGQDGDLDSVSVLEIPMINQHNATAVVQYLITFGKYDESKTSTEFSLLFEDNEWRIDDFKNYKWRFKDYLESSAIQEEVAELDSVEADTINVE